MAKSGQDFVFQKNSTKNSYHVKERGTFVQSGIMVFAHIRDEILKIYPEYSQCFLESSTMQRIWKKRLNPKYIRNLEYHQYDLNYMRRYEHIFRSNIFCEDNFHRKLFQNAMDEINNLKSK